MTANHVLDDLTWRGLIAQSTEAAALYRDLEAGPVTVYAGFDPTAPSLHMGNMVPLLTLARFQRAGHRPTVLEGGATGLIWVQMGRTAGLAHNTRVSGGVGAHGFWGGGGFDFIVCACRDFTTKALSLISCTKQVVAQKYLLQGEWYAARYSPHES